MESYWTFGDLKYYESRCELERPGGVVRHLRPMMHSLLLLFLESNGRTFKTADLVSMMWKESDSTATKDDFYKLKEELNQALGRKANGEPYIVSIPKLGYRLTVKAHSPSPHYRWRCSPGKTTLRYLLLEIGLHGLWWAKVIGSSHITATNSSFSSGYR
jgi:DNA-binding winged helix-turn-helix (wHTH) protein